MPTPLRPMPLPDFLIIGAMKCGTDAAARNLAVHPDIWLVDEAVKRALGDELEFAEVQFFNDDTRWARGEAWYRRFFEPGTGHPRLGEKSAEYLNCLAAHERMYRTVPRARLIVLLREPVSRALSHWRHLATERPPWDRLGLGAMSFEEAVRTAFRVQHERGHPPDLLWKGCYAMQLEHLLRWFPREQVLLCVSERVRRDKHEQYARMMGFLGLAPLEGARYEDWHVSEGRGAHALDGRSARRLREFYAPHNERLFRLLGARIREWDQGRGCVA